MVIKDNIAHICQEESGDWLIQTIAEHQANVAHRAAAFTSEFGMGEWGTVLGLLHDKGKERKEFQSYIKRASGYDLEAKNYSDHRHAYVGALLAKQLYPQLYPLLCNELLGHHRGLYDSGEVEENLKAQLPKDVSLPTEWATLALPKLSWQKKDVHHLERMLYMLLPNFQTMINKNVIPW